MKLSDLPSTIPLNIQVLRSKLSSSQSASQPYYTPELGNQMGEVLKQFKAAPNDRFQWNWLEMGYRSSTLKARLWQALMWVKDNHADLELRAFAERISLRKTDSNYYLDLNPEAVGKVAKQTSLISAVKVVTRESPALLQQDDRNQYIATLKEGLLNWLAHGPINTQFSDIYKLNEDEIAWFVTQRDSYDPAGGVKGRVNAAGLKFVKTA